MFEAKLSDAVLLKKLIDSIKELVTDANFECNDEGLKLQAMDNSHVALVAVALKEDGFLKYRCDRTMPLGVNLGSLTKVLKCAKDDDVVTIKASDDADVLSLTYEGRSSDRIAEYDMKLMDIDVDNLGIPDTEYDACIRMPSSDLSRIVKDLSQLSESVRIEVSKEGVRFAADGEAANGSVLLKQTDAARRKYANVGKDKKPKKEEGAEDEDRESGSSKKAGVNGTRVKKEPGEDAEMEEVEEDDGGEFKAQSDDEAERGDGEEEREGGSDEEEESSRKRKKAQKATGKAKKAKKSSDDEDSGGVSIDMSQHVSLTFSLKYLVTFSKSAALSETVQLFMSNDVPLLVAYDFGPGHIHYYLAPKIGDE